MTKVKHECKNSKKEKKNGNCKNVRCKKVEELKNIYVKTSEKKEIANM